MISTRTESTPLQSVLVQARAPAERAKVLGALKRRGTHGLGLVYALERLAAATAVLVLAPLGAVLALAIFAVSGRSPLVRHRRTGFRGAPLPMLKFRTMWENRTGERRYRLAEDVADRVPAVKNQPDARVTSSLAAFCRRYSIDELPQLWHVVKGEMSLVGPRPVTAEELREYYGGAIAEVLSVRPGLTGLWQTMGRNKLTYAQRKRLDVFLARRISVFLYFRILLRSLPAVVKGKGAF